MGTLTILKRLMLYANWPRHPLVHRELEFITPWAKLATWLLLINRWVVRAGLAIVLLAIALEVIHHDSISVLMSLFAIFMPLGGLSILAVLLMLLVTWPIPLALSGSISILRERTAHTWELLLLTSIPHSDILLSKLAVGLSRQQPFITVATVLQAIPLIGLLGAVSRYMKTQYLVGSMPLALLAITTLLFVIDRVQQFTLFSLLGLVAGLLSENWALGIVGAAALSAAFWLIRNGAAFIVVYLMAGEWYFDSMQAIFVGFPALAVSPYTPGIGLGILIVVIAIQECCVRGLFHWLVNHVSR